MREMIVQVVLLCLRYSTVRSELSFPPPVGFWMFDNINEGKDLSGNGNDADLYNIYWSDGPYGTPSRTMTFTGAEGQSSRAYISNANRALSVGSAMTYLTWFRSDNVEQGPLFSLGHINQWGSIFWQLGDSYGFHPRLDDASTKAPGLIPNFIGFFIQGEWVQVAVTYDQSEGAMKIYRNGEEQTELRQTSWAGVIDDQYDPVYIGAVPGDSRELHGSVFCTMYFGAALSLEQISAAFSLCRPPEIQTTYPWPSPVAHWPLNSYHGINNAADGLDKDGIAYFYSMETGPYGDEDGSYSFHSSKESYALMENIDGRLNANSFTFSAWIKPVDETGPIFRVWGDGAANSQLLAAVWTGGEGTKLTYGHKSGNAHIGGAETELGIVMPYQWNYIAVVYDYGVGTAYIYVNDVLRATSVLGNYATQMGPFFSLAKYFNTGDLHSRDTDMSCVQWYNTPLSLNAIMKIKKECHLAKEGYKPEPVHIYPFHRVNGLKSSEDSDQEAVSSDYVTFVEGARKRPDEAVQMMAGQIITLPMTPSVSETNSYTIALHLKLSQSDQPIIKLLNDVIVVEHPHIKISYGGATEFLNVTAGLLNEFFWLAVVHDGDLGVTTIYVDGSPVITRYVGDHSFDLSSVVLTNIAGTATVQCYQLYLNALNLREIVNTRDACIAYGSKTKLPYPRGFWPLNEEFGFREITGRSPDLQELENSGITFNTIGPYGEPNSAAVFNKDSVNSTLHMSAHRGLDVKFSMTFSGWIKLHSTYDVNQAMNIFSYQPTRETDYTAREDNSEDGMNIEVEAAARTIRFHTSTTNSKVTTPEYSPPVDDDKILPKNEWVHIAVVYDYHRKTSSVYRNGKLSTTKRVNRHIVKTFYDVAIGGKLNFDDATLTGTSRSSGWIADASIHCYQLYDVALSEEQIQKSMKLCSRRALSSAYSANILVDSGHSMTSPDLKLSVRSQAECVMKCTDMTTCQSVAYGDRECDISESRRQNLGGDAFSNTGKTYLEKDLTPWKLFV